MFKELTSLITFLNASEITAGYNGIRDHLIPLYEDFFNGDLLDESTKSDL